jgi:four helix bundle protein
MGSASELEYQLLLARDLGLLTESQYAPLSGKTVELKRMLAPLIKRVRESNQ